MSATANTGSLYLVDAYALIFQVFHAIRGMTGPTGLPTNALFGFTRDMLFLHQEKKPDYLLCVFDGEQKTFRDELYFEYKANRSAMPEDLVLQIEPIRELLKAMNIPIMVREGYEADDVIATLAVKGANRGLDVFICSSDKDCRQLISEKVKIYNLRKHQVLDREGLYKDWGITPEQVIDFQALVGDSVDNVPGVPGVGPKTASELLQQYENIENIIAHIGDISGKKRRENLQTAAPNLELSRKLVRLVNDVPLEYDWDSWKRQKLNAPRLLELFREWGFHRFADQVLASPDAEGLAEKPSARQRTSRAQQSRIYQNDLFGETEAAQGNGKNDSSNKQKRAEKWEADYHLVDTSNKFDFFLDKFSQCKRLAIDLETTGLEARRARMVGYAFCFKPGEAWYLPVSGPKGSKILDPGKTLEKLTPVLTNPNVEKINQNIKYDSLVLRQQGIRIQGIKGDSMIADYLLNSGERIHDLDTLSREYLKHEMIPIEDLIGKKGPSQRCMDEIPPEQIAPYAAEDADVAWRLCDLLEPQLEEAKLRDLYNDLEIPLIEVLGELEYNGIRLDINLLKKLSKELGQQIKNIELQIHEIADEEFNIASLKQLRRIMFDKLEMKKTGRRTTLTSQPKIDQETLELLASETDNEIHKKFVQLLLEHRRICKLKGTYIDTLPELVNPNTNRIHASFHQTVAATGRLSSSDPNLQNIPIRTELGGQIRQAFLPEEGWFLLTADYSQIELRLLAQLADDSELLRAFTEDRDIHSLVATQIYGVAEENVSPEMRRMAKTVNFGVIYGMSAFGLAQRLQIPRKEAATFIEAYFQRYPKVLSYQDGLLHRCREQGFVATILGRKRYFNPRAIRFSSSYRQRNQAEREAINMEIQGSAADLIKVAMLNLHRRLKENQLKTRMLLQIHDELVFETPPEEMEEASALVRHEMTHALADRLKVPLKVDVAVGPNWLDVEELNR